MKRFILLFAVSIFTFYSCASDDDSSVKETSLQGKWNAVSIKYTSNGQTEEEITTCQLEFLQFNFINDEDLTIRATSDDPMLEIGQCDPKVSDYTYEVANGYLTVVKVNPDNSGPDLNRLYIESSSSTNLVLSTGDGSNSVEFTLIKE